MELSLKAKLSARENVEEEEERMWQAEEDEGEDRQEDFMWALRLATSSSEPQYEEHIRDKGGTWLLSD